MLRGPGAATGMLEAQVNVRESALRVAVVASHPVQYMAPWFRALARACSLHVFYAHRQSASDQALAGYGVAFDWDVDLLGGYEHTFLRNRASKPNVYEFRGCDTPEIGARLAAGGFSACIVCGWNLKSYWQAVLACRRAGVPVFARGDSHLGTPRGIATRFLKRAGYPWMLRAFDGFLSPGQRHAEYLRHYAVPEVRIHFVPHLVDDARFGAGARMSAVERVAVRRGFGATENDRVVLQVGRLIALKRPLDAIEAVARMPGEKSNWIVAYVGAGPLRDDVERRARELGVRVALLGMRNQSELPALYASADALVLASDSETWGIVVNEALASGLPVAVSAAVGCAPDLVDPRETGFCFRCGDMVALAGAIDEAVKLRTSQAFAAAVTRKLQHYGAERAVAGTLDAVRSAQAGHR